MTISNSALEGRHILYDLSCDVLKREEITKASKAALKATFSEDTLIDFNAFIEYFIQQLSLKDQSKIKLKHWMEHKISVATEKNPSAPLLKLYISLAKVVKANFLSLEEKQIKLKTKENIFNGYHSILKKAYTELPSKIEFLFFIDPQDSNALEQIDILYCENEKTYLNLLKIDLNLIINTLKKQTLSRNLLKWFQNLQIILIPAVKNSLLNQEYRENRISKIEDFLKKFKV